MAELDRSGASDLTRPAAAPPMSGTEDGVLTSGGDLSDARAVIVIADRADAAAAPTAALASVAHQVLPIAVDWSAAAARIEQQPRLACVVAATEGVVDKRLSPALAELAAAIEAAHVPLIVGFASDQLDLVAAQLLGREVVLLCEPTPVEWAAALAVATIEPSLTVRDTTAADDRYQRLSAEVARIAETLAQLTARDGVDRTPVTGGFVAEALPRFAAAAAEIDAAGIRRAIRARRLRDDAFQRAGLFEDPAWDMLLDLFAAELERRRVSISSLCIAAAVAPTTALRWIGKLIEAGLLERRPDPDDRRRAFISLTARASTAMRHYLASLQRAGLSIG